jgi:aryl-alcohol dehydrogenase-like predicted oxidoreductase
MRATDCEDGEVKTRTLGDAQVSAIGLGAMPLTMDRRPPEQQAVEVIHAALDAGVTLIDTADSYGPSGRGVGASESLVATALASYPGSTSDVLVATKGGHTRDAEGNWGLDGRPEYLRAACEQSLRRLGVEAIDLYQHHRPDPSVPYAETMGGLKDLYDDGLIRRAGISNADPEQIRLAQQILGAALVAVQNEFSPRFRSSEPEIAVCAELGIAFLPWSPLGGIGQAKDLGSTYAPFAEIAAERRVSPFRVCLAWELALSDRVIPIPGASRVASIQDSAAAADLVLTDDEIARLTGS